MLFVLLLSVALVGAYRNEEMVNHVNQQKTTWVAGHNEVFDKMTQGEIKQFFGWRKDLERPLPGTPKIDDTLAIPSEFVAATNWPNCKTIGTIYNQARCGSCWAFGGGESASDRFCIATKGAFNQALSFADITECDQLADGCEGGSNYAVWTYLSSPGIVTDSCYPYNVPTCPPAMQPCLNFVPTPNCWTNNTCDDGKAWKRYSMSNVYNLNSVTDMQRDIMTKGPIEACFTVYEDFLSYKHGVYQHTSGDALGGHCIKIQGWGVENGTPYWLANNQWTTYWGDKGQFKIIRGIDDCGIEDDVASGDPAV